VLAVALAGTGLGAGTAAAQQMILVGSHVMKMVDDTTPPIYPGKKYFNWKVRSGQDPAANQIVAPDGDGDGDPRLHGATLTIYNAAGSGEVSTVDLPAESWARYGSPSKGYRYIFTAPPPITKIWLRDNKLTVRGGKAAWGYSLDEPSQGALAARLTFGTAVTWCTVVHPYAPGDPPSSEKFDRVDLFRGDRSGVPPDECPPVPTP
jgi:hypothetical protein